MMVTVVLAGVVCCCFNTAFCPARYAFCACNWATDFVVQPPARIMKMIKALAPAKNFIRFISAKFFQNIFQTALTRFDDNPILFLCCRPCRGACLALGKSGGIRHWWQYG